MIKEADKYILLSLVRFFFTNELT